MRHTLLILLLFVGSIHVFGQAVVTNFDKKIIYTDSLNLPRNTSASVLITLLPELLQRPGDLLLSNYDIQIEGMSVSSAADVALYSMQTVDIEKVEVTESPMASYKKNGQGGSINLVLRSSGAESNKHWGSAGVITSTPLNLSPQFNVGYRNKGVMVRGILLGELHNATSDVHKVTYDDDKPEQQTGMSSHKRFRTELARAYMQFDLTKRDRINLDLSEIYTYGSSRDITDFNIQDALTQRQKSLNLQTHLRYKHTNARSAFAANVEYAHTPSWVNYVVPHSYGYRNDASADRLSGKLEFKSTLFGYASAAGGQRRGELTAGINFNATYGSETAHINDEKASGNETERSVPQNDTHYIMPYMTFIADLGKLHIKVAGEFQHFNYRVDRIGIPYSATSNDFTGKFMAEWRMTELRNLRFILDRKLQRPAADQLYPYRMFSVGRFEYVEGNPDLRPMMVHEAMLDYMGTYRVGDGQSLVLNAGASISRITDIISNKRFTAASSTGGLGYTQSYLSFENRGSSSVANANLMALYTYKAFTISLAGNVYHRMPGAESDADNYTYYNLSLAPYFRLKDGWHGGARLVYFSRVNQRYGSLGDCAACDMTVGKALKRFFIYITESVSMLAGTKDVTRSDNKYTETRYNMLPSTVGIGMKYSF